MMDTTVDTEQMLREIDARNQIHDALMRYCRGADRLDRELMLSAYHPGARDNHGGYDGPVEAFFDWAAERHRETPKCAHFLGNSLIELDGDTAHCETYVIVFSRTPVDGILHDLTGFGRYLDRFECRGGIWKIAERYVVHDKARLDPLGADWDPALTSALTQGTRDRTDPSYRIMKGTSA